MPISNVFNAVNVVVAILDKKNIADSFSFISALLMPVKQILISRLRISKKTKIIATDVPIISKIGIQIISVSFLTNTKVKSAAIDLINTYLIVITCISSRPLNKKSIKKHVIATTTNERIVYNACGLRIGMAYIIITNATNETNTRINFATIVSPII